MRIILNIPPGYEKYDRLDKTKEGVRYHAYRQKTNHLSRLVFKTILVIGLSGGIALCSKRVRHWVGQAWYQGDVVYKVANRALGMQASTSKGELREIAKVRESIDLPEVPEEAIDKLNKKDLIILGELFSELDSILEQDFNLHEEEVFSHQHFQKDHVLDGRFLLFGVASSSILLAPHLDVSNGKWGLGRGDSARELSILNDEQISSLLLSYFMTRFDRDVPYRIIVEKDQNLPFTTRISVINGSLMAFGECQAIIDGDNCENLIPENFDLQALKTKVSQLKLEERFLLNHVFQDIDALCGRQKRTRDLLLKVAQAQVDKWAKGDNIQFETDGLGSFSLSVACRSSDTEGWKIGSYDQEMTTLDARDINLLCTLYALSELEEPPLQSPAELIKDEEPFVSGFSFSIL
ncbi:MAG: hypothetical protein ACSNEK_09730 [Parachlamydiaceae bacterium]